MKIGAYQFAVTGRIEENMQAMRKAVALAAAESADLLVFSECALTGYPPVKTASVAGIDFHQAEACFSELQELSTANRLHLLTGCVTRDGDRYLNSAALFRPGGDARHAIIYGKRALWGWDRDNFTEGNADGIFEVGALKVGVRICFEVRFPEYFRELYQAKADLAIVLFSDVSDEDDVGRYELIKAHLRTRAAENVCAILSVNDITPYQTAPTAVFDNCGEIIMELTRNEEGLLLYDHTPSELPFGAQGRKAISDKLTNRA